MTKIDSLRRLLLPCYTFTTTNTSTTTTTTTKKRLSTSLRDDIDDTPTTTTTTTTDNNYDTHLTTPLAPPRPSKSMVICTFFGQRRAHVFFCVQIDRLSPTPSLLLELSLSTHNLVKEMRSGLVRIALECNRSDLGSSCPLHSVPVWSLFCNARRVGSATRRKPTEETRLLLKKMENTTVGAGVIPSGSGQGLDGGEVMYMRANYEWIVGGADSQSFHLISPDDCPGQELSVFLLRSR